MKREQFNKQKIIDILKKVAAGTRESRRKSLNDIARPRKRREPRRLITRLRHKVPLDHHAHDH